MKISTGLNILIFAERFNSIGGVMIDNAEVIANADGKKIVLAGTIINGSSGAAGILVEDVDVTFGAARGTVLINGVVDINKLPESPTTEDIATLEEIIIFKK